MSLGSLSGTSTWLSFTVCFCLLTSFVILEEMSRAASASSPLYVFIGSVPGFLVLKEKFSKRVAWQGPPLLSSGHSQPVAPAESGALMLSWAERMLQGDRLMQTGRWGINCLQLKKLHEYETENLGLWLEKLTFFFFFLRNTGSQGHTLCLPALFSFPS